MKTSKWFVMVRLYKGYPTPLFDEENDVVLFDTEEEAIQAAKKNMFGETFGYEIYEW